MVIQKLTPLSKKYNNDTRQIVEWRAHSTLYAVEMQFQIFKPSTVNGFDDSTTVGRVGLPIYELSIPSINAEAGI